MSPLKTRWAGLLAAGGLVWTVCAGGELAGGGGWVDFNPAEDGFGESPLDLRYLNEAFAGEHGWVRAEGGRFVRGEGSEVVRFWAVNGPSHGGGSFSELRRTARWLAKYGVNMARRHGAVFDGEGELKSGAVKELHEFVRAMKAEGIYTHLSIYFPLWFKPAEGNPWLAGYDGNTHPFAALMFNPEFQQRYRAWWKELLTRVDPETGKALVDEPALFGVEVQNEDSFFFWTFDAKNMPDAQLRILETLFGEWLVERHGSLAKAIEAWGGLRHERDREEEGRVGFRPLWSMFNERTVRDRETVRFLWEQQAKFYRETVEYLRGLGFKGLVSASNWTTASPEYFGPLEKMSYLEGDFVDRHGYFECDHEGDNAAWSVREGHTYRDRSAYRFDGAGSSGVRQFIHPVMDPEYGGKPSMISETTFCRPNRYRSEAPWYYAVYGVLQGTDAVVHFALDGGRWAVKPNYWMQQWTLMSPAMMGQFPASALVYRRGLLAEGGVMADIALSREALLELGGTPLPQGAALDELRMADVPAGWTGEVGGRIDPLVHYVGRVGVRFVEGEVEVEVADLKRWVDRGRRVVESGTGEVRLDFGKGVLTVDAPMVQGCSGSLAEAGEVELGTISVSSGMELGHIVVVALDGKPLGESGRMLLQVMSEERETGREVELVGAGGVKRIVSLGGDPWQLRELGGVVRFRRPDAAGLVVKPLDFNGYPVGAVQHGGEIRLKPETLYYLITL